MRQTKLAETLRTLTVRERSSWQQYVWSDYANRHKTLRALCDAMLAHAPQFDESLQKRQIFVAVFGHSAPYNELKINNLTSDLYELLLEWLALNAFNNECDDGRTGVAIRKARSRSPTRHTRRRVERKTSSESNGNRVAVRVRTQRVVVKSTGVFEQVYNAHRIGRFPCVAEIESR